MELPVQDILIDAVDAAARGGLVEFNFGDGTIYAQYERDRSPHWTVSLELYATCAQPEDRHCETRDLIDTMKALWVESADGTLEKFSS